MRDRKLVEKFYQLYDVKRIRLEDVLFRMSHEIFFLDTNYIYKRIFYIPDNLSYYERLKEGKSRGRIRAHKCGWISKAHTGSPHFPFFPESVHRIR